MSVLRPFGILIALFAVLALSIGCGGDQGSAKAQQDGEMPDPLVMGLIPAEDNQEVIRGFQPTADYLGEQLGTGVELYTATDYTGIIEAMRSGEVDLAWFGPLSYILAADVADAEAIVVQLNKDSGAPTYRSLIVTQPGSGIGELGDLEGRTFSFVDPASTSGYLVPSKAITDAGLDPQGDIESTFAGGHDASALAVSNGTVDAGAVANNALNSIIEEGLLQEDEVEIIYESEDIPESPIAVRGDLPQEVKDRIQEVFLNMSEEEVGAPLGIDEVPGYQEASDSDYDPIRELSSTLNLDLEEAANRK